MTVKRWRNTETRALTCSSQNKMKYQQVQSRKNPLRRRKMEENKIVEGEETAAEEKEIIKKAMETENKCQDS